MSDSEFDAPSAVLLRKTKASPCPPILAGAISVGAPFAVGDTATDLSVAGKCAV